MGENHTHRQMSLDKLYSRWKRDHLCASSWSTSHQKTSLLCFLESRQVLFLIEKYTTKVTLLLFESMKVTEFSRKIGKLWVSYWNHLESHEVLFSDFQRQFSWNIFIVTPDWKNVNRLLPIFLANLWLKQDTPSWRLFAMISQPDSRIELPQFDWKSNGLPLT